MYSHFRNEIWIYDVVLCVCTCPKKEYSLAGRRYSSAYAQSSSTDRLGINLKSWDGYEFQNYERRARGGGKLCSKFPKFFFEKISLVKKSHRGKCNPTLFNKVVQLFDCIGLKSIFPVLLSHLFTYTYESNKRSAETAKTKMFCRETNRESQGSYEPISVRIGPAVGRR